MAIGPVQLIVLGFSEPDFHGEIIAELERLHDSGTVRVIDSLVVYKDAAGELEVEHLSNLTRDEAIEVGTQDRRADRSRDRRRGGDGGRCGGRRRGDRRRRRLLLGRRRVGRARRHPEHSAAALILIEHHWAVPLRDAVARAGGFRISDGFISPVDLIAIGLLASEDVDTHTAAKPAAAPAS